jgi:hypothetical protein
MATRATISSSVDRAGMTYVEAAFGPFLTDHGRGNAPGAADVWRQ